MKVKKIGLIPALVLSVQVMTAQTYQVPVSEQDEKMMTGRFEPTWESLKKYESAGMVQKCQIRYLGTLGTSVCGRVGRLDGAFYVYGRYCGV